MLHSLTDVSSAYSRKACVFKEFQKCDHKSKRDAQNTKPHPHYVITNSIPPQSNGWLYNGTKEKHSGQATMPQHYPTKTQTYKIIGLKRKIILYNRDQIFQIEYIESDKAKRTRLRPSTSQRPRRSSRIEEPHRIWRPNKSKTEYQDRIKRLTN